MSPLLHRISFFFSLFHPHSRKRIVIVITVHTHPINIASTISDRSILLLSIFKSTCPDHNRDYTGAPEDSYSIPSSTAPYRLGSPSNFHHGRRIWCKRVIHFPSSVLLPRPIAYPSSAHARDITTIPRSIPAIQSLSSFVICFQYFIQSSFVPLATLPACPLASAFCF